MVAGGLAIQKFGTSDTDTFDTFLALAQSEDVSRHKSPLTRAFSTVKASDPLEDRCRPSEWWCASQRHVNCLCVRQCVLDVVSTLGVVEVILDSGTTRVGIAEIHRVEVVDSTGNVCDAVVETELGGVALVRVPADDERVDESTAVQRHECRVEIHHPPGVALGRVVPAAMSSVLVTLADDCSVLAQPEKVGPTPTYDIARLAEQRIVLR